jgi:hypothetical protein
MQLPKINILTVIMRIKKSGFPPEAAFFMQNTEGYTAHPFHKKHPHQMLAACFWGKSLCFMVKKSSYSIQILRGS